MVSEPQSSCLSLPNRGITGAYYCTQLQENFKAVAYQDENLVADCYFIPVQGTWQHDVFFVKRGDYFRYFFVTVETTEKTFPISTTLSSDKNLVQGQITS